MSFTENVKNGLVYMTASNIETVHAFTTRIGGVSGGIYAELNLGEKSGDSQENVTSNYRALCEALSTPFENLVFPRQIHSNLIRCVSFSDVHKLFSSVPYEADGLITSVPELPLIIFTADCIPVLLYDPTKKVIGAVHCGWRGSVANIAGEAVSKMHLYYGSEPSDICAAIGPGIGLCCFETGDDVAKAVRNILGCESSEFVFKKDTKYMVDLKGTNKRLLEKSGILPENITVSAECTMCSHEKYWSHRYTKGLRGSQAAIIMLKGNKS